MTKQPEALRLADVIDAWRPGVEAPAVAAELRRLSALNAELVEALKVARSIIGHPDDAMSQHIASVLSKTEAQQ